MEDHQRVARHASMLLLRRMGGGMRHRTTSRAEAREQHRVRSRGRCRVALPLALLAAASGCIYVPPVGRSAGVSEVTRLRVGVHSRAQVIAIFGEPNVVDRETFIVREWRRNRGHVAWAIAAGGQGDIGAKTLGKTDYRLLAEFGADGLLTRFEIETRPAELRGRIIHRDLARELSGFDAPPCLFRWTGDCTDLGYVRAVRFSPDGSLLALQSGSRWTAFVNPATGPAALPESTAERDHLCWRTTSAAAAGDGQLAPVELHSVVFGDARSTQELVVLGDHAIPSGASEGAGVTADSRDGRLNALAGVGGAVHLRDRATESEWTAVSSLPAPVRQLRFSPDAATLAINLGEEIIVVATDTGERRASLSGALRGTAVRFSADGRFLSVNSGAHVELWEIDPSASPGRTVDGLRKRGVFLVPFESPTEDQPHPRLCDALPYSCAPGDSPTTTIEPAVEGAAASVWNTLIGYGEVYFDSATMFVFFLSVARHLEMTGRYRVLGLTDAFARHLPRVATRIVDDQPREVGVMELAPGDLVLVYPGQTFPADGILEGGDVKVDESLLTGESEAILKSAGDRVVAGAINQRNAATMRVDSVGADTALAQISRLMSAAQKEKPPIVQLANRVASRFVTGVLLAALVVGAIWWSIAPERAFEIVLALLVVTCPCALALATPAAFTVATSALARHGFLVRRSGALEEINRVTDVYSIRPAR